MLDSEPNIVVDLRGVPAKLRLAKAEAEILEKTLVSMQHNKSQTAEALGISRGSLHMKLREYFGNKYSKRD